jgi:hypothetical protein
MSKKTVPTLDAQSKSEAEDRRFSDIELRLLDAGAKSKENVNREADQRFNLRRLAVGMGVLLILGMGAMLYHVAHAVFTPHYLRSLLCMS